MRSARPSASAPPVVAQPSASRVFRSIVSGFSPRALKASLSMQRWNWRPSRIWANMSPEQHEITSHPSEGRPPRSSQRRITGRPIPICISVSGVDDTAAPARESIPELLVRERVAVHVDLARAQQPVRLHLAHSHADLRAPDAPGVRGEERVELPRRVDLRSRGREREQSGLGESHAHREQGVGRGEVALAHAVRVADPVLRGRERRLGTRRREVAVGEDRAAAGVEQALHGGVGVLRGVHAVGEVEDRGDAGVQRLERSGEVSRRTRPPPCSGART